MVGKNLLRGKMLILGQITMNSEEKEKAEELINMLLQKDFELEIIKKKSSNLLCEEV